MPLAKPSIQENYIFRPLPSVGIELEADSTMSIQTPWMKIELEIDRSDIHWAREFVSSWKQGVEAAEFSSFLQQLKDYPLYYLQPMRLSRQRPAAWHDEGKELLEHLNSPQRLLDHICHVRQSSSCQLESTSFSWNLEEIKEVSLATSGKSFFDPLAALFAIRGCRLEAEFGSPDRTSVFDGLARLARENESIFADLAALIVRQTYYVTKNCFHAVEAARHLYRPARSKIEDFLEEESGHDTLTLKTLLALGVKVPESIQVLPEIESSISLLSFASCSLFFTFANMLSTFEGSSFMESDPLAEILSSTKQFSHAAHGIQTHFMINKNGKHDAIGEKLISELPLLTESALTTAVRLNELLVLVQNQFASKISRIVEEKLALDYSTVRSQ